jgi:tetratricopeptide (TPR) repeat protein
MMASSERKRDRVLLLHCHPPTPCLYPFEKGLRDLGHEVIAFGPEGNYGDTAQFRALEPDSHYTSVPPLVTIDELFDLAGGQPDWLLYLQPNGPLMPRGLRDCPVPTVGWLTEEYKSADVDQGLYYYFDLAPTAFPQIAQMYHERGYDHRACFNFTGCNWLQPDAIPDERTIDVSFVGMTNPILSRDRCLELEKLLRLRSKGIEVVVRGGVFLKDMLNLYARSKIVFQHSGQGENNLTYRVSEAMSAGALVLSRRPAHVGGMGDNPLIEGKHIVYYDDFDEAEELIRHYTTHEDERRAIVDEATRYMEQQYPWVRQIEWFVDECVHNIPDDFLARRHARLARFGVDERRERLDYALYFILGAGHPTSARTLVEEIPGWETDIDARVTHAAACVAMQDVGAYTRDVRYFIAQGVHPLALYNHTAVLFSQREHLGRENTLESILLILRRFERLDPDDFEEGAIEGASLAPALTRVRLEVARAHFDYPSGPARRGRLWHLYLWAIRVAVSTLHKELGQFPLAVAGYRSALTLMPDDGHTMVDLARALSAAGRVNRAIPFYEKGIALEPFMYIARLELATLFLEAGRARDAANLLADTIVTGIRRDAPYFVAFRLLALAHMHSGNAAAALEVAQTGSAQFEMVALETDELGEEDIKELRAAFRDLSQEARSSLKRVGE